VERAVSSGATGSHVFTGATGSRGFISPDNPHVRYGRTPMKDNVQQTASNGSAVRKG